ncbi:MAG: S41 family peptidase [Woeseiaceae bacterium]|nr:S41 family peptidase [Woeseiaceae bacterium]
MSFSKFSSVVASTVLWFAVVVMLASPAHGESVSYADVAASINATMRQRHYDPAELEGPEYRRIEQAVIDLGDSAASDDEFLEGFRSIWQSGPFSHVRLEKSGQSAEDMANYLDAMRVGEGAVTLGWQDDVAVLTVNTMMGLDTVEAIEAAYAEIANRDTAGLIIDLRANGGGAFAVRPLVSHLLSEPFDAGAFVSRLWSDGKPLAPTSDDIAAAPTWDGWSIKAFWSRVQQQPATRIRFSPVEPVYSGPVFVLASSATASAAEMAADALQGAGRARVVGETTAGEMLSQKLFDVPGGFLLSLPIADYYSARSGRIEGRGVTPDIETAAEDAMAIALDRYGVALP